MKGGTTLIFLPLLIFFAKITAAIVRGRDDVSRMPLYIFVKLDRKRGVMSNVSLTKPSKKYIHYGSDHFYKDLFRKIKNCSMPWNKPEYYSGLWASPIETDNGWFNWCTDNYFDIERLNAHFKFMLRKDSNVIKIHNDRDLDDRISEGLVLHSSYRRPFLMNEDLYFDFEKLVKEGYDAIEVYVNSNRIYMGLYGWDCDSLLVLNPDCVIEVE